MRSNEEFDEIKISGLIGLSLVLFIIIEFSFIYTIIPDSYMESFNILIICSLSDGLGVVSIFPILTYYLNNRTEENVIINDFSSLKGDDNDNYYMLGVFVISILFSIIAITHLNNNPHFIFVIFLPLIIIALRKGIITITKTILIINFSIGTIFTLINPDLSNYNRIELQTYLFMFTILTILIGLKTSKSRIERNLRESTEMELFHFQKLEVIGQMAGGVAHEVNNSLQIIDGYLEILSYDPNMEKQEREAIINRIKNTTDRTASLMKQMLTISRKQSPDLQVQNINELIISNKDVYEVLVGEQIHIDYTLHQIPNIPIDVSQIDQILLNLISNAKDAMKASGQIRIKTDVIEINSSLPLFFSILPKGEYVIISIEDEGEGIKYHQIENIFEPFYTSKPRGEGIGLGLSLVLSIINNHGGYIDVTSRIDKGTKFDIYLPVYTNLPNTLQIKEKFDVEIELNRQIENVLIIDDEVQLTNVISRILQNEGVSTSMINHPTTVIEQIENKFDYDFVISDILLPEINGIELAKKIHDRYPNFPILLISGFPDVHIDEIISENFPFVFLPKPFTKIQLFRHMNLALELINNN